MKRKSVLIGSRQIDCHIIKSNRAKKIKLQIVPDGRLELILPNGINLSEADKFLETNCEWIEKHLKKINDGKFFLFGREIFVSHQIDMFRKDPVMRFGDDNLIVSGPEEYKLDKTAVYLHWLRYRAKKYIPKRADYYARRFGFDYKRITIRNQRTRWGSCSARGTLSFNLNLMKYEKGVIDYVIVHELCHMREMNHSKKFWRRVEEILPDYQKYRKKLKGAL